jgi:hypothetical protein
MEMHRTDEDPTADPTAGLVLPISKQGREANATNNEKPASLRGPTGFSIVTD